MNVIDITVILCTYNRCELLRKALCSIAESRLSSGITWEILIVDNNSSDRTREVIEDFSRAGTCRVNYLFEPRPGLSNARNAGIQAARGDILVFTDDDVIVEPAWLESLARPLMGKEWTGVGGKVVAANSFTAPKWLSLNGPEAMGGILTLFDLGDAESEMREPPFGANMAFRKEMFSKYGGFRTDLGRSPGSLMSNEDTEFGRRLIAGGEKLRYVPDALVYHPVPENRLRRTYFLEFSFNLGRASIRELSPRPAILGIRRCYWTLLKAIAVTLAGKAIKWVFALNPQRRFYRKCWVWRIAGEIVELSRSSFLTASPRLQGQTPSGKTPSISST